MTPAGAACGRRRPFFLAMRISRERFRYLLPASRTTWFLAAALLLAAVAAVPLLAGPGLLNTRGGGDSPFLLQRLQQLAAALRDGHFPVRWMPDANYGYGYPFYNFYAPLSIYITAVFRLVGFSLVTSIQLSQLAGFLVAAWGMFRLGRRWWGSDAAGLLASVAYTAAPFHLVNVYVRGDSLAEFWAMAWYPWVIVAADGVLRTASVPARRAAIARLALAYAALILSHNISALIFSPFLLLYILLRVFRNPKSVDRNPKSVSREPYSVSRQPKSEIRNPKSKIQNLAPAVLALLLALGLAAWFFLPALGEQALAQLGPVTEGYFHYSNHFRGLDLVQWTLLFDPNPDGGVAFRMGLVQALTAVSGLLILAFHQRPAPGGFRIFDFGLRKTEDGLRFADYGLRFTDYGLRTCFTWLTFLVATFMITPLSRPLWDHLPLLPFTQFPWRFLSVQAFAGALAAGGIARLAGGARRWWLTPAVALALLVAGIGGLRPDYLVLTDADVTPAKLAQYEWFSGNIGTTVSAEYLPPAVSPRPATSAWLETGTRDRLQVLAGAADGALTARQATRQTWQIDVREAATMVLPTLYWPGWRAEVGDTAVSLTPAPGSGLIQLTLPAGAHTLTLRLARTPLRLGAELLSLLALLGTAWLLRPPAAAWRRAGRVAAFAAPALALLLITVRAWPRVNRTQDDLTWDFAQLGYLHHDTGGVPFSTGARLAQYTYSQSVLAPGDTLQVTLRGSGWAGQSVSLALTTPAANRFTAVPPLAAATQLAGEGQLTLALPLPDNAPTGLFVPRLRVADGTPLLPSGASRGAIYLRPVRLVPRSGGAGLPAAPLAVRLTAPPAAAAGALALPLAWYTAQPLAQNLNVSLRLLDTAGAVVAQFDAQPGYGFRPSSGWPAGQWVHDWLALPLPEALPETAVLQVQLYEIGGDLRLVRRLGTVERAGAGLAFVADVPQFEVPAGVRAETAEFRAADEALIRLRGHAPLAGPAADGRVTLTLYWEALAAMPADYTRFVHVLDASGALVAQADAMPRGNSYPTSQWQAGEIVADAVALDVADLPPGEYRLAVGFYENVGGAVVGLTAVGANGQALPDGRVVLAKTLVVEER